jgi:diguanylate cyclase (GGDEF)-like protein/PAS domain S-box-containing protein
MQQKNDPLFSTILDLLLDAVCVVDAQGYFVFVSAACEAIFGYTPQEMVGRRMLDMVAPEDRERTLLAAQQVMAGHSHLHFENRYVRKDGKLVDLMWSARWSEVDQVRIAVARDISARKRAQALQTATNAISEAAHEAKDMRELLERVHQIIDQLLPCLAFAVGLRDASGQQLEFPYLALEGNACTQSPSALVQALCEEIILAPDGWRDPLQAAAPRRAIDGDDAASWLGVPLITQQGVVGALVLKSPASATQDRETLQCIATQVASAVERRRLYASLQFMAHFDTLTGLVNRSMLHDRLCQALARAAREGLFLCVLYLDLNRFKQINDSLGHSAGDSLLKAFAQRLKACFRSYDTVARVGGDEFVVLLESSEPIDGAWIIEHTIGNTFDAPFEINGQQIGIQTSIGSANFPAHGSSEHELLQHADNSMYRMKKAGGYGGI